MSKFPPPPIALFKVWLSLTYYSTDEESKRHAEKMLIKAFGSVEVAVIFAEENGINVGAH